MSKHRDNEKEYIESVIKNNPDRTGWFYAEEEGDVFEDWYFITQEHSYFSNKIIKVNDELCAFGEYGRALNGFVSCSHYTDEHDKTEVWLLNSFVDDTKPLSMEDYFNLGPEYRYFFGKDGLQKSKIIKIRLSDNNVYELVTDVHGQIFSGLIFDNRLCVKGLIANEHMFVTPYKTFGTIIVDKVPFLVSPEGSILNTTKFKYREGKVYAYVNSDKTFFYSTNSNDKKWY